MTVVFDAGLLISLFNHQDEYHQMARAGITTLEKSGARMIAPAAIVLETAKRLLYDVNAEAMHASLDLMLDALEIINTTPSNIREARAFAKSIKNWRGSIEDALVICTAQQMNAAVWTLNFRDFAAVDKLDFWNP